MNENTRAFDVTIKGVIAEPLGQPDRPGEPCYLVKYEVAFTLPDGRPQRRIDAVFILDFADMTPTALKEQVVRAARELVDRQRRTAVLTALTGSEYHGMASV
jgi:hypothetical protein